MAADTQQALQQLGKAIDGTPPPAFEAMSAADIQALSDTLQEAHRRQQTQLKESLEHALSYVPKLLRGAVRKVLFPS